MPVLMFHSVGCEKENWYRNWLSVSLDHFEKFCEHLVKKKYKSIFLDEWYNSDAVSNFKENSKQVVITFDDGYLDNWIFAFPILKKYNLKGTIFVNPEFIDNTHINLRPNLDDVWSGRINSNELKPLGFLNWNELIQMQNSGIIDIQSHSMSHNFYFSSDNIKDIYTGQPNYDWLAWIKKSDRKPYYTTEDQTGFIEKGNPIFNFDRALRLRRYFPDDRLVKYAIDLFETNNSRSDTLEKIKEKLKSFPGSYESDEDMERRYRYELFESKKVLEDKLNKSVDFLCWPGGGYNDLSVKLSIEAGYKASTVSFKDRPLVKDNSGKYKRIKRYAMGSFISTSKDNYYIKNSSYLVSLFKGFEGDIFNRNLYRARKLSLAIKEKII